MLSLPIHSDENPGDEVQPQTRQSRREAIREKKKEAARRKTPTRVRKTSRAEFAEIRRRQKLRDANAAFADHCYVVAQAIMLIADDIENCTDESRKWFQSHDHLVDALAREHNVVNKYRVALSSMTRYERRVINGALMLCELDGLLLIEKRGDWMRLHVLDKSGYTYLPGRRLRAA